MTMVQYCKDLASKISSVDCRYSKERCIFMLFAKGIEVSSFDSVNRKIADVFSGSVMFHDTTCQNGIGTIYHSRDAFYDAMDDCIYDGQYVSGKLYSLTEETEAVELYDQQADLERQLVECRSKIATIYRLAKIAGIELNDDVQP